VAFGSSAWSGGRHERERGEQRPDAVQLLRCARSEVPRPQQLVGVGRCGRNRTFGVDDRASSPASCGTRPGRAVGLLDDGCRPPLALHASAPAHRPARRRAAAGRRPGPCCRRGRPAHGTPDRRPRRTPGTGRGPLVDVGGTGHGDRADEAAGTFAGSPLRWRRSAQPPRRGRWWRGGPRPPVSPGATHAGERARARSMSSRYFRTEPSVRCGGVEGRTPSRPSADTQPIASAMPGGFCTSSDRRRATERATCSASDVVDDGTRRRMISTARSSAG
jgi:hypothetical protein